MIVRSNFIQPWKKQNFERFRKSYKEIKLLLNKNSKNQSRKYFLITMVEFTLALILILAGTQTSKLVEKDLNHIDNIITLIAIIFSIYFIVDFIFKFQKIKTDSSILMLNQSYKKTRKSFQSYFFGFTIIYGIYSIVILNSIFNQEQNYKALVFLKKIEANLRFYQSNSIILIISIYTILVIFSIWFIENLIHKKLFHKINMNLIQLKHESKR